MKLVAKLKDSVLTQTRALEDLWFDRTRGVATASVKIPRRPTDAVGPLRDSQVYLPARARNMREALLALPLPNPAEYTFVDLGSGKGRAVFIASELPFKKLIGVEYSLALHRQAEANLRSFRSQKRSGRIEFVHADAAEWALPPGKLVVFLFNPFGEEVMSRVLDNLRASLQAEPRHVLVVLLQPELAAIISTVERSRLLRRERRFDVFEIGG